MTFILARTNSRCRLSGSLRRLPELHLRAQPQRNRARARTTAARHVIQLGEVAQPLVRLQQHRERQQMLRVLGPAARPLRFRVRRGKGVSQFPPWHHPAKPRDTRSDRPRSWLTPAKAASWMKLSITSIT